MIYFDSASTSYYRPDVVKQAVVSAMTELGSYGRGAHAVAMAAGRAVHEARCSLAEFFGACPDQVAFTHNATMSLNMAIFGLLDMNDHVITTVLEHNSVLRPLHHMQKKGLSVDFVGLADDGNLDYDALPKLLHKNTKCVIITHCSNVTGLAIDLEFVAEFCKKNGLILIVDAAQSAGIFPIDMHSLGRAVLCFTGHKGLLGPQGTGGLVVSDDVRIPPMLYGGTGSDGESIEAGTFNAHGIAGLAAGVEHIKTKSMDAIRIESIALAEAFAESVRRIPDVKILGNSALMQAPIVSININDVDSAEAETLLSAQGLCVRGGFHCAQLAHRALGTMEQGAVRFSFSAFNTINQVEIAIQAVAKVAKEFA